jgi:hypothetical protein
MPYSYPDVNGPYERRTSSLSHEEQQRINDKIEIEIEREKEKARSAIIPTFFNPIRTVYIKSYELGLMGKYTVSKTDGILLKYFDNKLRIYSYVPVDDEKSMSAVNNPFRKHEGEYNGPYLVFKYSNNRVKDTYVPLNDINVDIGDIEITGNSGGMRRRRKTTKKSRRKNRRHSRRR